MGNKPGGPGGMLPVDEPRDSRRPAAARSMLANDPEHAQVTRGSVALTLSIAANALGGLLFWLAAARAETSESVGESSALFQSLLFINFVASLGLPVAIGHYGTGSRPEAVNLSNLLMIVRIVAAVFSTVLFLAIAGTTDLFSPLWKWGVGPGLLIYLGLSVGAAMAVLFEIRLIALRLWKVVLFRSVAVAVTRLPLLLLITSTDPRSVSLLLFAFAALPVALSGYLGALWLRLRVDWSSRLVPRLPRNSREIMRYAGVNWVGLLATQGPLFAIPVVVGLSVDSADNPAFYVAWSFGAITFLLPQMIGQVVLSEANTVASPVASLFQALRIALLLTMVAAVMAQLLAGTIANVYGPDYADIKTHLPLLLAAGIAWSYTSIGLAAARVREENDEVLVVSTTFLVSTVVPAAVLTPRYGADAATWSWLAGNCIAALVTGGFYLRWRGREAQHTQLSSPAAEADTTSADVTVRPVAPLSRYIRRTRLVLLVGLGLLVAACSGGSAGPTLDDEAEPEPVVTVSEDLVRGGIVIEAFNGGTTESLDNTDLEWLNVAGSFGIEDGQLRLTSNPNQFPSMLLTPSGGPDGLVLITMGEVANQSGLVFRYVDSSNYWILEAVPPFATWNLKKVVDGEPESLGNADIASVSPNTSAGVLLQEESITVLIQGRPRLVIEDDTHMAGNYAGVYAAEAAKQLPRWEEFMIVSLEINELREVPTPRPRPGPFSATPFPVAATPTETALPEG